MQLHVVLIALGISFLLMYIAHRLNQPNSPTTLLQDLPDKERPEKVDITNQGEYR
jgi:hypothetical protein